MAAVPHAVAAEPIALCGRTAASQTQLYFDIAKSPTAHVLRATERESVIADQDAGVLWTFVVKPVALVVCRANSAPDHVESACEGDRDTCADLVQRLTKDPRAEP